MLELPAQEEEEEEEEEEELDIHYHDDLWHEYHHVQMS